MISNQPLSFYYSAIKSAIEEGNLALVVDHANTGLKEFPKEAEFAKIEIVALIKQEHPRKALDAILRARTAKLFSSNALTYEEAYCHFTLGGYNNAKTALRKAKPGVAVDRLVAQIAYKSGQFSECIEAYKKLLLTLEPESQEYNDVLLNLAAAMAALAQNDGKFLLEDNVNMDGGSYELLFNVAAIYLACDKINKALKLIDTASQNARETLVADGWPENDILSELGPLEALRAVALQKLGKPAEAHSVYSRLISQGFLDNTTRDVVLHNLATLSVSTSKHGNCNVSKAKHKIQIPGRSASSLTHAQRALMQYNMAIVHLRQHQYSTARRLLRNLSKQFSDVAIPHAGIVSAIASLHMGNPNKALNELSALSHAYGPVEGVRATLAAAQVAAGFGEIKRSVSILNEWLAKSQSVQLVDLALPAEFVYYYFGVSLIAHCLALHQGSAETTAKSVASSAAEHLYAQFVKIEQPSMPLAIAMGDCLSYSGATEMARECFNKIKANGPQRSAEMSFVLALDKRDRGRSIAQLLKGYNKRARVSKFVPGIRARFARQFQPRTNGTRKPTASSIEKSKTTPVFSKGKRSSRYRACRQRKLRQRPPKNYDASRQPDSERWVPLKQRSYYKPRGRGHRQQPLRGGAQGGAMEAGSGLGGTGSARISGKSSNLELLTQTESNSAKAPDIGGDTEVKSTKGSAKSSKQKGNGKGKSKGKGKKGTW
ncbi:Srp72p [Coemansia spiralis]|uniref:Signal recognition particle subunit SRP72 n=2 Tax=Coemansia TaxID=4863 RepID=A0A9W8G8X1_9FUNG|nr:Srp72p [Coemansia umbellata]KAJ2624360.1 Srp72p [Coemansia sp. RSA 1358]KAJ2677578.1 Srp72p [Coemansia spiralis]